MPKYVPVIYKDFSGGQNDISSPEVLKDNELRKARNIDLSIRSGFSIRKGCVRVNAEPFNDDAVEPAPIELPISRLIRLKDTNLAIMGAYMKKWDGTTIQSNLNSADVDDAIMNERLYYIDGTQYWEYDGMGPATGQVEENTVVGVITGAGNASVVVTANGMTGTPKTLSVAVLLGDDESAVAEKIRQALSADADVSGFFTVSGSGADVTLTAKTANYNDTTMNLSIDNGTCTGLTAKPASTTLTEGAKGPIAVVADTGDLNAVRRCKYMVQRGRRFYFAGDPQGKNDIIFTEPGKPKDCGADLNVLRIVPDDNDEIIGLTEFHKATIVFKNTKVYGWFGSDPASGDISIDELIVHDGSVAQRTIVKTPKRLLVYLSGDGVITMKGTDEGSIYSWISSKNITNFIRSLTNLDKARAVYYKGLILIACCTDGTGVNNQVAVAFTDMSYTDESGDLQFPWAIWDGWYVNEWFIDNRILYYGDARTSLIMKALDGYNDDGQIIVAEALSKNYDLDTAFNLKRLPAVYILAQQYEALNPSTAQVMVKTGYNETTATVNFKEGGIWGADDEVVDDEFKWDDGSLYGWIDTTRTKIRINKKAHFVTFHFTMNTLNNLVTIYGVGVPAKLKRIKGVTKNVSITEKI